jgi:hypothetical protein
MRKIAPWLRRKQRPQKRTRREPKKKLTGLNELANDRRIERSWEEIKNEIYFLRRECESLPELKKSVKKIRRSIDNVYRFAKADKSLWQM